jgi:hypothetical protein
MQSGVLKNRENFRHAVVEDHINAASNRLLQFDFEAIAMPIP